MRHLTLTETGFAAPGLAASAEQSALQITRAAIARWRGNSSPSATAPDLLRVSPQARWVAEAQDGLADWIARGGFAQADEAGSAAPLAAPSKYHMSALLPAVAVKARSGACID